MDHEQIDVTTIARRHRNISSLNNFVLLEGILLFRKRMLQRTLTEHKTTRSIERVNGFRTSINHQLNYYDLSIYLSNHIGFHIVLLMSNVYKQYVHYDKVIRI